MIRIDINMVPRGVHIQEHRMATITLTNDGTDTNSPATGNYNIAIRDHYEEEIKKYRVTDFDRSQNVLYLLQEALNEALDEK